MSAESQTLDSQTLSQPRRIIRHIAGVWAEMDYAQRRMLEINTGVGGLAPRQAPLGEGSVRELESHLYAREGGE